MRKYIRKLIKDVVHHSVDKVIFEYALPMDVFMSRYMDLSQQVIENWCLVRYARLVGKNDCIAHWKGELRGHLLTLARLKINSNNSYKKRFKTILRVWQSLEYTNDVEVINKTINNKFQKEHFDTSGKEYQQILHDCMLASSDIINTLAKGEISDIDSYLETL